MPSTKNAVLKDQDNQNLNQDNQNLKEQNDLLESQHIPVSKEQRFEKKNIGNGKTINVPVNYYNYNPKKKILRKNHNKRPYKKHFQEQENINDKLCYDVYDGVKIYDGSSQEDYKRTQESVILLANEVEKSKKRLLTDLQPSTLTAKGRMTNVLFNEQDLIKRLPKPKKYICLIGCNYGEIYSDFYIPPQQKKTTGRGRKPKPKNTQKRKVPGSGKYFISQITFLIILEDNTEYKIKLFRNGVFQVPGVISPNMYDLIRPVSILRDYLRENLNPLIEIIDFKAVMRNYKCRLADSNIMVALNEVDECILLEKNNTDGTDIISSLNRSNPGSHNGLEPLQRFSESHFENRIKNRFKIAEITYNNDKCSCLICKFYRPTLGDQEKKTTVKLLKKGKINFDGGNSEEEVKELYYWFELFYQKYADRILCNVNDIVDGYITDSSQISIYDSEPVTEVKKYRKHKINKKIRNHKRAKQAINEQVTKLVIKNFKKKDKDPETRSDLKIPSGVSR